MLLIISLISPWWSSFNQSAINWTLVRRNEALFLWGYYASVNGEWGLGVFSWRLALVSDIAAGFAFDIALLVASLLFIFYGNRRKSSELIIVGSILALIAPLLFYSLMNAVTHGKPVGSSFGGGSEGSWGFSFGFYLAILSSPLGFTNAYLVKRNVHHAQKVKENDKLTF